MFFHTFNFFYAAGYKHAYIGNALEIRSYLKRMFTNKVRGKHVPASFGFLSV